MLSLTCGVLDPVPRPGIEPWFPALAVRRSLSHRTTRKVLVSALQCLQSVLWLNASPFSVATSLVPGKDACPPGALSPRQTLKGKPFLLLPTPHSLSLFSFSIFCFWYYLPYFLIYPSMCVCVLSRVRLFATPWTVAGLFATPWTVAGQAPLFAGFSRQEYWSGSPFPCPIYSYIL